MSQVLRLKKTLCLLRNISVKREKYGFWSKDWVDSTVCPNCTLSICPVASRSYSFTSKLLSNGSTKVKVTEGHSGRRRWKKRKSGTYKDKVESDLFKLLNARTTQLALGAIRREFGETDTRWTSSAILVVPETSNFARNELDGQKSFSFQASSVSGDHVIESTNSGHSLNNLKKSIQPETWDSSVDAFKSQFLSTNNTQTEESHFSPDGANIFSEDSKEWESDVQFSVERDGPENSRLHNSSSDNIHNQSNASCADYSDNNITSIPSLSDTSSPEQSAKFTTFIDSRKSVSVNANILRYKQFPKYPEKDQFVKVIPVPEDVISRHVSEGSDLFTHDTQPAISENTTRKKAKTRASKVKAKESKSASKMESGEKAEQDANIVNSHRNTGKWDKIFNQDLSAYVDACCFAGLLSMAQSTIRFYHHNKPKNSSLRNIQDISIYNTLMHSWAKQGNIDSIKELFSFLRKDGLKPTLQSYAACLECLHHQKVFDVGLCQRVLQDLEKEGLELKNIFNECTFKKDERQAVLKAIHEVQPDFEPHPPPEPAPYTGPLLEGLNHRLPPEEVVERNPYTAVVAAEEITKRMETQLQRELKGSVTIKSVAKKASRNKKISDYREKLESVRKDWREIFYKGMERKVKYHTRKNKGEHGLTLFPYLKLFSPQEYADCMMLEMEKVAMSSDTFSPSMNSLWRQLGVRIYNRYNTQEKIRNKTAKKISKLYHQYAGMYNDEESYPNHRECWHHLMNKEVDGTSLDVAEKPWPKHILKGIGKMLYDIILYDVKIDSNILKNTEERKMVPAFYTVYRTYGHKTYEEIKPNPVLVRLYQGAELDDLTFDAAELPMLCPPIPWVSQNHGGSLLGSARLIRLPDQAQNQSERLDKMPASSMYSVLDSLNTLGACAWVINKQMLDLIIGIFNNKGLKDLDIPPPVSDCPPLPKMSQDMTSQEKSKVYQERIKLRQERSEMYSLWCSELYRLSIANTFRDEIFWFPHNMDFRGRTYPCPPHFNHLGSDVARSILQFAKGKPLGERGLDWLKIHLVNLTGFKKRTSNKERLEFANEIMPDILDSADNPLEGRRWWQGSDEPWQTLACCKEIANAARSPDPTQYMSHYPVHQDGSCNGLQHYAALGRDQAGAESVNLHPFPIPQDVYSDVAELVEKVRQREAEEGEEIAQMLEGFVRRKVIKQTVMTTVYGVTKYGAKYQILRQLKDIPDFPQDHVWAASAYLTQKTFQCLREMFTATKEIQDWLTLCAHLISTVSHKPVEWVTPLGLLVIQPYHKQMSLSRFGVNVIDNWNDFEKPNAMKQKNGFPPNYIHSLDSTHMMLTSLYCLRAGITYVSVHDCFWTHPADVEVMNRVCREQFVSLHRQPILEDLSLYLLNRFISQENSNSSDETVQKAEDFLRSVLAKVPSRGTFDLDNVLESTYFFS